MRLPRGGRRQEMVKKQVQHLLPHENTGARGIPSLSEDVDVHMVCRSLAHWRQISKWSYGVWSIHDFPGDMSGAFVQKVLFPAACPGICPVSKHDLKAPPVWGGGGSTLRIYNNR